MKVSPCPARACDSFGHQMRSSSRGTQLLLRPLLSSRPLPPAPPGQEARASESPRQPTANVSVRSLLLAGAYPLVPKERVPQSVDPVRLYGEYTPISLLQGEPNSA